MTGQDSLAAMRLRSEKPSSVFLEVDCVPGDMHAIEPGIVTISIELRDVIPRLDLRALVGCTVHVLGRDETRMRQAFDAAVAAGASLVLTVIAGELCIHGGACGRNLA